MKVYKSAISKIRLLGNRILLAPFGQKVGDVPPDGCKVIIPCAFRPSSVEGIVVQIGTPHRGSPKKGAQLARHLPGHTYREASDPGGHKRRRAASFMLDEIKIGDHVRVDASFGHHKVRVGTLDCQIHSVLDILFIRTRGFDNAVPAMPKVTPIADGIRGTINKKWHSAD